MTPEHVFLRAVRDPTTGQVRDLQVEIFANGMLLVRLLGARAPGEDAPHHAAADFTEARQAILAKQ